MQETVQKAIEEITYRSKKFPGEAFRIISENKETAVPYLRAAVEKALLEKEDLEDDYQLHFYALFFLGEFQERGCFPLIVKFVSLPEDVLEGLIGDLVTEGLKDILYNTYNGDLDLVKRSIGNSDIGEYVRSAMLDLMGQLYLDGELEKEEWEGFIREFVHDETKSNDYLCGKSALAVCDCHLADMLPEIRQLYDEDRIEEFVLGSYDSCVDMMFRYSAYNDHFCKTPINTAETLQGWAMFDDRPKQEFDEKKLEQAIRKMDADYTRQSSGIKIGRNDLCPCGSGKKYKKCCLNKPKRPVDLVESEQEKKKWLEDYPVSADVREEGRIYLEDYYDAESIAIDKLVYLALHHRAIPIWHRESAEAVENRQRIYLSEAFAKFVEKAEKEKTETFQEYDEKYSIHYRCQEWIYPLMKLLKKSEEKELYKTVSKWCKEMKKGR